MKAEASQTAGRRVLRIIFALQGHAVNGIRLKQIADTAGDTASSTLRTLQMLQDEGVAERIPGNDEHWRLSPRIIQLARAHEQEMARAQARLDETVQRYSRTL